MRRALVLVGGLAAVAAAAALWGGAGPGTGGEADGSGAAAAAPAPRTGPGLARFASCRGFLRHVRRRALALAGPPGLGPRPVPLLAPAPAEGDRASAAPAAGVDFSDTNVQEAGVDEPDLVETDGRTLFSLAGGRLRAVDVGGAVPRLLASLEIPDMAPSGMLLLGDRLVVLGDRGAPVPDTPIAASPARIAAPSPVAPTTVVVQVDVADPSHPRVVARMSADGRLVTARGTGRTVRVVLASTATRVPLTRRGIARANATAWLPRVTVRNVAGGRAARRAAVGCRAVSRPAAFAGLGMVSVLTIGVSDTLALLDSDAVLTDGDLVYASAGAMYVATPRWAAPEAVDAAAPPRGATLIHRFDTSDPAATTYRSSGAVRGHLLGQFAMSEHEGHLRVASTEEPDWWSPPDDLARPGESVVTVLAERGSRLERVGQVDGLGRGERIVAVRFMGPRGYVVTFRQTDPLYALDLADPARPTVRGVLKIPGFSSYLHPVDDSLLIGVGQDADDEGRTLGTQVSLFDVSDLSAPRRIAQRTLGIDWSDAESDHHAALYWPPTGLLVLPAVDDGGGAAPPFLGAVGLTVARATGVTPVARVRHPGGPGDTGTAVRRSVVVGDALHTVSDAGVLASDLRTLAPRAWVPFG